MEIPTRSGSSHLCYTLESVREKDLHALETSMPIPDVIFQHRWLIREQAAGNLDYVIARQSKYPVGRGLILWHGYVIPILMKAFPQTPVIRSVEVLPQFRGAGIGTAIVHELERRASERGYTQISLGVMPENVLARKLWHRLGYVDWDGGAIDAVSTYEGPHGETVTREERFIPMRKQLLDGYRPLRLDATRRC